MPAILSKGELVSYITYEGIVESRIVGMAKIDDGVYYLLENGDYVVETHFGIVKTSETKALKRAFYRSGH